MNAHTIYAGYLLRQDYGYSASVARGQAAALLVLFGVCESAHAARIHVRRHFT
jgi:hypothetical protein